MRKPVRKRASPSARPPRRRRFRGEYLQKFEGNQFEIGLTEIYTRGFLRGYANYLRVPSERLMSDYTALRGGEPRVRQPSREVYGRMDLAISSADERGEAQQEASQADSNPRNPGRFPRPGESLPKGPAIDPALVFKGGIVVVVALVALVIIWIAKSLLGNSTPAPSTHASPQVTDVSDGSSSGPAATVSIVALDPVRIKVVRKSDGVELFQGALQTGDRREYPNVPIFLTASELGAVEIDYKGRRYPTGHSGHDRIQFDFSSIR